MAKIEIEGANGLPWDTTTISDELQQVLHGVGCRDTNNIIIPPSTLRYSRRVIVRINKEEENSKGQKRKTMSVIIKVSVLSHKRAKKCYPRLASKMFHKIYHMCSDIKNKGETNAAF